MKPPAGTKIDLAHPLASRIIGYFNGADGVRWTNGPASDKNTTLEIEAGHSTQVLSAGPLGRSILADFTTDDFDNRGFTFVNGATCPVGPTSVGVTVVMAFNATQSVTTDQNLLISLGATVEGIFSGKPGQTAGELGWHLAAGIRGPASIGMDFTSPGPKIIAASYLNDATYGGMAWYKDGALLNSGAELANWIADSGLAALISNSNFGLGQASQDLAFCLVLEGTALDGQISHKAIASLTENPWQIFKPKRIVGISRVTEEVKFSVIKKVHTKQPPAGTPIDWGSLINVPNSVVIVPGWGSTRNIAHTSAALPSSIGVGDAQIVATQKGVAKLYTNYLEHGDNYGITDANVGLADNQVTMFAVVRIKSGEQNPFFGVTANANQPLIWLSNLSTEGAGFAFRNDVTYSHASLGAGVTIDDDEWHVVVGRHESSGSGGQISFWLDTPDSKVDGSTNTGDITAEFDRGVNVGGAYRGSALYCDSDIALCGMVLDTWTDGQVARFLANPWQIFEPELIHVPFNEELPKLATFEREW